VAPLETAVAPNSKDVREGGQEASPKRESGRRAAGRAGTGPKKARGAVICDLKTTGNVLGWF
jgi:hypothetical protein